MAAIRGHFDGKVIVPDEPLDLQANQRVIIHVEPIQEKTIDYRSWIGQANAAPQNNKPRFFSDRELWE